MSPSGMVILTVRVCFLLVSVNPTVFLMSICVYLHACMCACVRTCVCAWVSLRVCASARVCIYMCMGVCVYVCVCRLYGVGVSGLGRYQKSLTSRHLERKWPNIWMIKREVLYLNIILGSLTILRFSRDAFSCVFGPLTL